MKVMVLIFFIALCKIWKIESHEQSEFIIDYFVFKQVPYVVGFSCWNVKEKLMFLRKLNKFGIRSSFPRLDVDSHVFWMIGSKFQKIGIFVDISCFDESIIHFLLTQASDWRLYGELHTWIILSNDSVSEVVGQLDESAFGMSTDLVVAVPINNGYQIFDIYNPWKEGGCKMNVTDFGVWDQFNGLNITSTKSKFRNRCNLNNVTMKAYFFRSIYKPKDMPVDEYMRDESTLYKDGLSKWGYYLVTHLSEMFNFSLKFGEIKKWYPGDTLGPMTRSLVHNEIQITGSPVIITEERLNLSKFVYPAWPFRTCFIFRSPQKKDIKIGEVLHPFTDECWYATLLALLVIFLILAISFKKETCELSGNIFSNSFITTIGSMCQQGITFDFERISTRIIFFNLMIFSFLTYNYYNAVIVSTRLNEPILKINDSLNELGKLGFKMSTEPMNYFEFIFTQLNRWERQVFYIDRWTKIPEAERYMNPEKAVPLVQKGGFAYHTHPDVSYPIIDRTFSYREICELMEVHPVPLRYSTLSVQYNSSFVEMAKIGFSRMTEVGLRTRQILKWTSRKPQCLRDSMNIESTDIYEFAPHLMLLALGILITLTIFVYELILSYWWNYNGDIVDGDVFAADDLEVRFY